MSNYLTYEESSKLQQILDKKLKELLTSTPEKSDWNSVKKELKSGFFQGYKTKSGSTYIGNECWDIYLNDDCCITIIIPPKGRYSFYLNFGEVSSSEWWCSESLLRKVALEMPKINTELEIHKSQIKKRSRIIAMSQKSIHAYLSAIMKNSGYKYFTTNDSNKVLLSIKMKRGVQLNIPIYYRKFQTIMPKLLETIKCYEKSIYDNKVKVLISNLKTEQTWQQ